MENLIQEIISQKIKNTPRLGEKEQEIKNELEELELWETEQRKKDEMWKKI